MVLKLSTPLKVAHIFAHFAWCYPQGVYTIMTADPELCGFFTPAEFGSKIHII